MYRCVIAVGIGLAIWGCSGPTDLEVRDRPHIQLPAAKAEKLSTRHLVNAIRIHDRVISGGLPDSEAAFAELKSLGVKTVISVDGAKPDVAMAERYGLSYVHLPHGYDGVPESRALELARAVRKLDGPIYIHCHHGRHRSPAAAAVACVGAGLMPKSDALKVLETAGTSHDYLGLFQSARNAVQFDQALLGQLEVEFKSVVEIPPIAEAMVNLEVPFSHLQEFSRNKWRPLPSHPDLSPAHEALILREHFAELMRTEDVEDYPLDFSLLLTRSSVAAEQLALQLKPRSSADAGKETVIQNANRLLESIALDCRECHRNHRD